MDRHSSTANKARTNEQLHAEQGTRQSAPSPKYVVAIDFGTTFSGVCGGKVADVESVVSHYDSAIHLHDNWPGQGEAGAKAYCKTQTSVWYMPGSKDGTWELEGWGWTGYLGYIECLENAGFTRNEMKQLSTFDDHFSQKNGWERVSAPFLHKLRQECGYFVKDFKVGVAGSPLDLPPGLTLERVISDYLRELSTYNLKELQKGYGSDVESQRDIQYILTVPAMWTIQERQTMKYCAEMAGMVRKMAGKLGKDSMAASPYDLIIVTEPEAAAVQVHKTLQTTQFNNGDQFLVVDVGGGTTDIVLHEKTGSTTRRNIRVREVSASVGALVGGIHVDEQFFNFMRTKIGCFSFFQKTNPLEILEINRWWNDVKTSFCGEDKRMRIPLPSKLVRDWQQYDKDNRKYLQNNYDDLLIWSEDLQNIFNPVIDRILDLIRSRLVPKLRAILVVGGFSESPYLQRRIKEAFCKETETIFMRNAGSAVVRGAVLYGVANEWVDMVRTRIAKRTIGFDTSLPFINEKHRRKHLVIDQVDGKRFCDNIFGVLIRRGQEVPDNYVRKETFEPLYRIGREDGDDIVVNLYETEAKNPLYVTDRGARKLTTCSIPVPRKESIGGNPKLELAVHFGTLLKVSVEGKNFFGERVSMPPVKMNWAHI